jgi:hypothetical protein
MVSRPPFPSLHGNERGTCSALIATTRQQRLCLFRNDFDDPTKLNYIQINVTQQHQNSKTLHTPLAKKYSTNIG